MEKHLEVAREYGFTRTIDCGALNLHIFHQDYLDENSISDNVIELASVGFSDYDIPCLTSSGLEILPETAQRTKELVGIVNFMMPTMWQRGEYTNAMLIKRLQHHLASKIDYHTTQFEATRQTLIVNARSDNPLHIKIETTSEDATFEFSSFLTPDASSDYRYDEITLNVTLWGHLHDFIAQSGELPFSNRTNDMKNAIYIGETPHLEISDTEIIIGLLIEEFRNTYGTNILPQIGHDIDAAEIDNLATQLSDEQLEQVALELILDKRREFSITGEMTDIQQGDIIAGFVQQLRTHRQ